MVTALVSAEACGLLTRTDASLRPVSGFTSGWVGRCIQPRSTTAKFAALRGLTSVEIVVVLIVMVGVVIVGMRMPYNPPGGRNKANIKAAYQDMSNIKTALEKFKIENGRYPTTAEGLESMVEKPNVLQTWPSGFEKLPIDPWNHPYIYRCPGTNGADYDLLSTGLSGVEGNPHNLN